MKNVVFVGIDFQNDFVSPKGALSVPGADADAGRFAEAITKHSDKIGDIVLTMDSHRLIHIAHPKYWVGSNGNNPDPFTVISSEDLAKGTWRTTNPADMEDAVAYIAALDAKGRYKHCIWPQHCLIGSSGWLLDDRVYAAAHAWEKSKPYAYVDIRTKGSNLHTEHFSAIGAEVPNDDPSTRIDGTFIEVLQNADVIVLGGEALSHCLRFTIEDLVSNFDPDTVKKMYLLSDCASVIPGFEVQTKAFLQEMESKGMNTITTANIAQVI